MKKISLKELVEIEKMLEGTGFSLVFDGDYVVTPKSNVDKMKPFSDAVSKGLENDEVLSVLKVFEKMTYTQRFELYETNPELHDKLSKATKRHKMKPSSKADAEKIDELFKKTQD